MKKGKCVKISSDEYGYIEISGPEDYAKFETYCAYCVKDNIYLRTKHIKPGYENAHRTMCEYEDDGHCINHGNCPHKQIIGYIKCPDGKTIYPLPGEIVLLKGGNFVRYMSKEQFNANFRCI